MPKNASKSSETEIPLKTQTTDTCEQHLQNKGVTSVSVEGTLTPDSHSNETQRCSQPFPGLQNVIELLKTGNAFRAKGNSSFVPVKVDEEKCGIVQVQTLGFEEKCGKCGFHECNRYRETQE